MDCAYAVRVALHRLAGVQRIQYDARQILFKVSYDPQSATLDDIFNAVFNAGLQMELEYSVELVSST
jgi:copper chaperone CopZ